MPEPWWGWAPGRGEPLHSVIINLNPGSGGDIQKRDFVSYWMDGLSYSQAMNSGLMKQNLKATDDWHRNERAQKIIEAFPEEYKNVLSGEDVLRYHLSIELCPLHFPTSHIVEPYINLHKDDVIAHSLAFAAVASKEIAKGEPLRGIVLVRCSEKRFANILEILGFDPEKAQKRNGLFKLDDKSIRMPYNMGELRESFKDVCFVCISCGRNRITPAKIIETLKIHNLISSTFASTKREIKK